MPILDFPSAVDGRPVLEVIVCLSTSDRLTQPEDAIRPPRAVQALVDTGASRSHVSMTVLESLAIDPADRIDVYTASTGKRPESKELYPVDLYLGGDHPGQLAQDLRVIGSDKLDGLRVDMLLGRDVLDRCLLIYDGINRRFSLAYNPPVEGAF